MERPELGLRERGVEGSPTRSPRRGVAIRMAWSPGNSVGPTGAELQLKWNEAGWMLGLQFGSARSRVGSGTQVHLIPGPHTLQFQFLI